MCFGHLSGLSLGGSTVLGTIRALLILRRHRLFEWLCQRLTPAFYLTSSLAITFPFNIAFELPFYFKFASNFKQVLN